MNSNARIVPSFDTMSASRDGYVSLKKYPGFDKYSYQFSGSSQQASIAQDHISYSKKVMPHENLYLNKHEIFPGFTIHKQVALQK